MDKINKFNRNINKDIQNIKNNSQKRTEKTSQKENIQPEIKKAPLNASSYGLILTPASKSPSFRGGNVNFKTEEETFCRESFSEKLIEIEKKGTDRLAKFNEFISNIEDEEEFYNRKKDREDSYISFYTNRFYQAVRIFSLESPFYEQALDLLNKGADAAYILINKNINKILTEKEIERIVKMSARNSGLGNVNSLLACDDRNFEVKSKFLELCSRRDCYFDKIDSQLTSICADDELYEKANRFLDMLKEIGTCCLYGETLPSFTEIVNLPKDEFEQVLKHIENSIDWNVAIKLSKHNLSEEQLKRAKNFKGFDLKYAKELVLNDEAYERVRELKAKGLSYPEHIACDDVKYSRYNELIAMGLAQDEVISVLSYNDEKYNNYKFLQGKIKDKEIINELIRYDREKIEKVLDFLNTGYNFDEIKQFLDYDTKSFEKALSLLNQGLDNYYIKKLCELEENKKEKAMELFSLETIPDGKLSEFAEKDEETIKKYTSLWKLGIREVRENLLEEEQFSKTMELGQDKNNLQAIYFLLANNDDLSEENVGKTRKFLDLFASKNLLNMSNAQNLVGLSSCFSEFLNFDENGYKKVSELIDIGMKNLEGISEIAILNEDYYKKAIELYNQGFSEEDLATLATIDDEEQLKKIEFLVNEKKLTNSDAIAVSQLKENYDKALKLIDNGIKSDYIISKLINKEDDIIEKILRLKETKHSKAEITDFWSEFLYSSEATKKLNDLIDKIELKEKRWETFVNSSENKDKYKEQLDENDIGFLIDNAFESEFFSPTEYVDSFLYFKNLKTKDGDSILRNDSFFKKIDKNEFGDFAVSKADDSLYKNIKEILLVNPGSITTNYIQTIIDLIGEGKINPSAFRTLTNFSEVKSIRNMIFPLNETSKNSEWRISNNVKNDIELFYQTIVDNRNKENLDKEVIDNYIKTYKTEKEAIQNANVGDAFILENEKYIRIKSDNEKSEKMKITKDTYGKLFPPIERFLTTQQTMGNCYCIETLMSIYCDKHMRADFIKLIEEKNNGDITIKFKNYSPVVFEKGLLPKNESEEIYSSGAYGFKLFEYAYSKSLVEDKVKKVQENLSPDKLNEFNNFIQKNKNNFFIYEDKDGIKWTTFENAKKQNIQDNNFGIIGIEKHFYNSFENYLLGNGGNQADVYNKFDYESKMYLQNESFSDESPKLLKQSLKEQFSIPCEKIYRLNKLKVLMRNKDFFKENLVQLGIGMHAYSLTQETDNKGNEKFYLYNPHNQGFPIEVKNLDNLFDKISFANITRKK